MDVLRRVRTFTRVTNTERVLAAVLQNEKGQNGVRVHQKRLLTPGNQEAKVPLRRRARSRTLMDMSMAGF